MNYNSKKKVQSKLAGFEDVSFTLAKMSEGRRMKLRIQMSEFERTIRDLGAELQPILDLVPEVETDTFKHTPENYAHALNLIAKQNNVIDNEVNPAWVRWGLVKIEGLKDEDGKLMESAEDLINDCPTALFKEILEAIKAEASLSEEERKN